MIGDEKDWRQKEKWVRVPYSCQGMDIPHWCSGISRSRNEVWHTTVWSTTGLTDQLENVTAGINESRESLQDLITKHAMMEIWPAPLSPEWPESFWKATRKSVGVLLSAKRVKESGWTQWFCRRGRQSQDDRGRQGWVVYNVLGPSKQRIKIICLSNKAALQVTIVRTTPKCLLNQLFILLSRTDAMICYRIGAHFLPCGGKRKTDGSVLLWRACEI